MSDNRNLSASPLQILHPKVLILSVILTGSILTTYTLFNRYLKQYTKVTEIPSRVFKKEYLYGKVTSVGDGDNFHFFHTPGGYLGGWGWLRAAPELIRLPPTEITTRQKVKPEENFTWLRSIFSKNEKNSEYYLNLHVPYRNKRNLPTLSIRLCGVDAPERAHFGNPAQPFSEEALIWLRHTLLGKNIWIKPLSLDQYGRCIAKVQYWTWHGWENVSLEMIKNGLGVVYEGNTGAEFDGEKDLFKYHENVARKYKKGIWSLRNLETPGEYKKRHS